MEGVGHPTFRHAIAAQGGLDLVCTEFVRITRDAVHPNVVRRAIARSPSALLSVQVMGNDPDRMAEAARMVAAAGADVVDINLGCPMPRIVKKGVGAAMLRQPDLLRRVLEQMRAATPGLLSAKIRAGYDDAGAALGIAQLVERAGVDFISVHPRRRADFYAGVADWRIIQLLSAELSIPVIGNGDLWYADAALRLQAEAGCHGVMIGRPAIRNPFIFKQLAALRRGEPPFIPTPLDLLAYLEDMAERYQLVFTKGRHGALGKLKELITFVARGVAQGPRAPMDAPMGTPHSAPGRADWLASARAATDVAGWLAPVRRCLMELPPSQLDLGLSHAEGLETVGSTRLT